MGILDILYLIFIVVAVLGFIAISGMFLIWWERKVAGHIQTRFGPMRVGWHGWLQSIADTIKLLIKEDIRPAKIDHIVFRMAPYIVIVPAVMAFVVIPFSEKWIVRDLNMGLFYIVAVSGLGVFGILMAGWASDNKYSLLGGMRAVAQMVSYEVPMIVSLITVLLYVGSSGMNDIVKAQENLWFIFRPNLFICFLIYFIAGIAETNRVPFDIPEAESELVSGFHTEYSGMRFALFFVGEYTNVFIVSSVAVVVFLGGWQGPILPGFMWFLIKVYGIIFVMMLIRWTFPRLRVDQLMSFSWKFLTPLAFINLAITAFLLLL
ncbi:MAG: NADH-quinone oxidoreductase subunit NuoH [Candidatus Ancaeobacter aquaticus]|nr:NADH-quinone oxidoreductase subunit NuoH [Candidatus Ancaeobacter aquaticus]